MKAKELMMKEAESIQDDMHAVIKTITKSEPKLEYGAIKDTYFMMKFAQMKQEIDRLKIQVAAITGEDLTLKEKEL